MGKSAFGSKIDMVQPPSASLCRGCNGMASGPKLGRPLFGETCRYLRAYRDAEAASRDLICELMGVCRCAIDLLIKRARAHPADPQSVRGIQWDAALEANAKGIQLDPYADWLVAERAWLMSLTGKPADALPLVAQAIELDPGRDWFPISASGAKRASCSVNTTTPSPHVKRPSGKRASNLISPTFSLLHMPIKALRKRPRRKRPRSCADHRGSPSPN
jgi:hypothetical protein